MKNPAGALGTYAVKRDFKRSAEPGPEVKKSAASAKPLFVIQKHAASHLHYDFRLEMEGVLKSWAVPKGLPSARGDKRLAMRVEDHPLDYARFEGIIAEGNYGAGTVMVWDIGTYDVQDEDPSTALEKGKLHVILHGKKLNGEWALVKIHHSQERGKEPWLIFKAKEDAPPISERQDDQSALSRRSMKQIAAARDAEWESDRPATTKRRAPRAAPKPSIDFPEAADLPTVEPAFVQPMLAEPAKKPPSGGDWIYEIKFDGIRAIIVKNDNKIELYSRLGNLLTARFSEVARAVRSLPCKQAVLDGEVVALEESGRSSFQLLQATQLPSEPRPPICCYLFDLLELEGRDLKSLPLIRRKEILQQLILGQEDWLRFSASFQTDPDELLEQIRARGLEGLIAKQNHSKYLPGKRTKAWLKVKCVISQEFVIGGFTKPKGAREYFGALLVGYFENKRFVFASKVGTGFDQQMLRTFYKRLKETEIPECPFSNLPEKRSTYGGVTGSEMRRCTWVRPELVCQIRYTEWTRDGHLRHPVFLGLREDKEAQTVGRDG